MTTDSSGIELKEGDHIYFENRPKIFHRVTVVEEEAFLYNGNSTRQFFPLEESKTPFYRVQHKTIKEEEERKIILKAHGDKGLLKRDFGSLRREHGMFAILKHLPSAIIQVVFRKK